MKKVLLLLALIGITFNYFASTHVVTNTNNTGAGSLRNTIAAASAYDTIRFDPNLIASGSDTIFLTTEIAFSKSLTIIGLYNATDTLFVSGNNSSRILSISHTNYTVLDSLVLINGNGRGVSGSGRGGAINFYNTDSLFVYNSVIKNNTSSSGGGAIYASSIYTSTIFVEITNSSVLSNTSSREGGGIFFEDPNGSIPNTLVLNNSTISENSASGGGGICMVNLWNQPVSLILNNSTVSENSASSSGGGIYVRGTHPLSSVTLNNSVVSVNSAENGGGIYTFCFGASTEVNLNHSTIYGNIAFNDGGGVFSFTNAGSSSSVTVKNSTVSGNSAKNGGGIYSKADGVISSFSLVSLTNSTLTGNSASSNGGGIYSMSSNISTITPKSSIIALNGNNNIYNSNTVNTITSQGYNILSETSITGSAPTDQLGVTAVQLNLGSLQNNGGTTETILPGCSSVAIDKGTPLDASAAQNRAITDSRRDVGAAEYLNPTTVNFTGSPLFGCAPLTTNFVDASSGSVAIASWAWDFGDGNTNSVKNPTHVYQTPGIYSISLEVTDINGCRTKFTRTNYLQAIGPDVDFGALQTTACLGSPINFKDSTIFGAPIISWTWNFGDGSSGSSLQNPTHTYSQSGTYTVSLKVTDIDGCFRTFTRTNFITISGTTKIVQNTNDSGPGSLRQVITDACSGDTIRFNPNLIASGSDTILLASQISFNKNLVFKGLYNSTDTLVVSGNNATRIFNVNLNSSSNKTLVMDSMVLVNGNTSGNGGAIKFSNGDSLIINNSTISHNSSSGHGGGIFSFSSSSYSLVKLTNSTILGNSSSDHGGGVYSATISSASSSFSPSNSLVKVINSTVTGNLASRDGGGVYSASTSSSSSSFVEVTNSTISDNSASRDGGGVYSAAYERSSSLVEVTNSTITNNSASDNGGGVCSLTSRFSTSFVIVINSTISDNSASLNGGGVYSFAFSALTIPSSSLISSVEVTNSTISGNSASRNGGGIFSVSLVPSFTKITLKSSIVANNGSSNVYNYTSQKINSQGYNILSNSRISGSVSTDQLGVTASNLNLGPLQNNGGVTKTILPGCGSVAINKGNPADITKAQNGALIGRRDVGAAESSFVTTGSVEVITACDSLTWRNGITYTSSTNTAKDTIVGGNSVGCDSIITLNLTINQSTYDTVPVASCYSYLSPSGNYTWTTAGRYQDTISNKAGCDSIITIKLTINATTYGSYSDTNCFSYTSPSGKYTWFTSGTYQDTILNASGCDSVITINLTILQNGKKTVMNFSDNGPGSLRELATGFCSGDTLLLNAGTILLTSGQIVIDKDVVIMGIDSASTLIDGGNLSRIFYIAPGVNVTISHVKLQNGKTKEGGAIYNRGNLNLDAVSLVNNKAQISNLGHTKGGAIYNKGRITITNSSLIGNSTIANGVSNSYAGAIFNLGTCIMTNCVAKGNSAVSFHGLVLAGVIYNHVDSKFELTNSQMIANEARTGYYGYGGAIVNRRGVVSTITNSSLIDNFAKTSGGAIHNLHFPNSITIVGGVLQGNQTESGPNDIGQGAFDIR